MFERNLSDQFLLALTDGHLKTLIDAIRSEDQLDFQVRKDYVNVYFRGASILKLAESGGYTVSIHEEYKSGMPVPSRLSDHASVTQFLGCLPALKQNVVHYQCTKKAAPEAVAEQRLLAASRTRNTDFFWIDRQAADQGAENEADLIGVHWPRLGRQKNKHVQLVVAEVKYGENPDIPHVGTQLKGYAEVIKANWNDFHLNLEKVIRYKTQSLGLFDYNELAQVTVDDMPESLILVIILTDYNPSSSLWNPGIAETLRKDTGLKVYVHRINNAIYAADLK